MLVVTSIDAGSHAASFETAQVRSGGGDTSLLGREKRAPLSGAALANATAGHALDYDNLSWGMNANPSVTMVAPIPRWAKRPVPLAQRP